MIQFTREVLDVISTVLVVAGIWGLLAVAGCAGWALIFRRFRGRR